MTSSLGSSEFSDTNYIFTSFLDESVLISSIYAKGTGINNHRNAEIKIDGKTALIHAKFRGLALAEVSRANLKVHNITFYDTFNSTITETVTSNYRSYGDSSSFSASSRTQTVQINNSTKLLEEKLTGIQSDKFVILVSCNGFEKDLETSTIQLLSDFGSMAVLDIKHIATKHKIPFSQNSIFEPSFFHHPFAMVGFRGLSTGDAFEQLRTNRGHYGSVENLPVAEVFVKLRYNKIARNFVFDSPKTAALPDPDFEIDQTNDFSLRNLLPLIAHANLTSTHNYHFSIHQKYKEEDLIRTKNAGEAFITELDRLLTGGLEVERKTKGGSVYQTGANVETLSYYDFYNKTVHGAYCDVPYDGDNCFDQTEAATKSNIEILQCRIGLSPSSCPDNQELVDLLAGLW